MQFLNIFFNINYLFNTQNPKKILFINLKLITNNIESLVFNIIRKIITQALKKIIGEQVNDDFVNSLLQVEINDAVFLIDFKNLFDSKYLSTEQKTIAFIAYKFINMLININKEIKDKKVYFDFSKLNNILEQLNTMNIDDLINQLSIDFKKLKLKYQNEINESGMQSSLLIFNPKVTWINCRIFNINTPIDLRNYVPQIKNRISSVYVMAFYKKFLDLYYQGDFQLSTLNDLMGLYLFESVAKPYVDSICNILGETRMSISNFGVTPKSNSNKGLSMKYGEIDSISFIDNSNKPLTVVCSVKSNLAKTSKSTDENSLKRVFGLYKSDKYDLAGIDTKTGTIQKLNSEQLKIIDKGLSNNEVDGVYIRAFNEMSELEKQFNNIISTGFALLKSDSILIQYESWSIILFELAKVYKEIQDVIDKLGLTDSCEISRKIAQVS